MLSLSAVSRPTSLLAHAIVIVAHDILSLVNAPVSECCRDEGNKAEPSVLTLKFPAGWTSLSWLLGAVASALVIICLNEALVVADGAAAGLPADCSKAIERLKGGELPEKNLMQPALRTKWQELLVLRFPTAGTIAVADVERNVKVLNLNASDMNAMKVWKLASERKPSGVKGDDIESMAADSEKRLLEPAEAAGLKAKLSRKLKKEMVPPLVVAAADAVVDDFGADAALGGAFTSVCLRQLADNRDWYDLRST